MSSGRTRPGTVVQRPLRAGAEVTLDSGAVMRASIANTARLEVDTYSLSQRVVAWFTPDDCVVLEQ